ncbi:flagellar hook capping FlgD N-terminal domain-containing protein [Halocynthiibacter sp.]|uniref:flagellar hook capping FlgD N-terminal domain-containing protein n=1 Tax=Halocynthiibacter sp. TaxID=1979210 RepID=UPI003C5C03A3
MQVTQTNGASGGQTQAPPAETSSNAAISSDFDTFLKMLTAQIQNQDPLNPIESEDYAVQLATFSSVEQQVQTNDLLKALGTQFGSMGLSQMASWIGMEARAAAPVQFDGSPIEISPNPAVGADKVELVVRDEEGNVVQREQIPKSTESFDWAGVATDGTPLPNGIYSFSVESFNNGQSLIETPAEVYAEVVEVRGVDGHSVAVLKGGAQVSTDAVSALRSPN